VISDDLGQNGNIWADPIFCEGNDFVLGNFYVRSDSPCLDEYGNRFIGAHGAGCLAQKSTWNPISAIHSALSLSQNHPSPCNPRTTFEFSLPAAGRVNLTVYGVRGQRVASLVDADLPAGVHQATWDGKDESGRQAA
jgi:hypothetical protein